MKSLGFFGKNGGGGNFNESRREWWEMGKAQIRVFCQEYTAFATKELNRVVGRMESDIVDMERQMAGGGDEQLSSALMRLRFTARKSTRSNGEGSL